jgi:hypothetical protein
MPKIGHLHKVCPTVLGFRIRAHIIQILCHVKEVEVVPLLVLRSYDSGMLLRIIGK